MKRKLAIMTAIALLCMTAAPASSYASGLQLGGGKSVLSQIGSVLQQKFEEKKNNDKKNNDKKNDDKKNDDKKNDDKKNDDKKNDDKKNDDKKNDDKKKPDPKAISAIVQDAANQLSVLQGSCQSNLVDVALQFTQAKTTHQKTALYAQGKAIFAGCVSSYTTIITNASIQLAAIGSDSTPLAPLNASFALFQIEGRAILNRIIG